MAALISQFHLHEKVYLWSALKMEDGSPMAVDSKAIGFCPVYKSKEELLSENPEAKDDEIKIIVHTNANAKD